MSSINFKPIFKEVTALISGQIFSTMYFGRHCEKNLLLLKHGPLTVMLVFGSNEHSLTPEFVKTISSRENPLQNGVEIVGNGNVILLLDEDGNLWKLVNAFEFPDERDECLYLLDEKCFYKWVPFKAFRFNKVFSLTAFGEGFACIGIKENSQLKLEVRSSTISDYTFSELSSGDSSYYLANIKIQDSLFRGQKFSNELLFITDRSSGRSYVYSSSNKNFLIHSSNIHLVCVINFEKEKCLLLCYQNGKIVFDFYDDSPQTVVYLSKNLIFAQVCGCKSCILWSDGVDLHHTGFEFVNSVKNVKNVKLLEMEMYPSIKGVLSFVKIQFGVIAVTVNNFYYHLIRNEFSVGKKSQEPDELLTEIYQGGLEINNLNKKIEKVKDYLECRALMQMNDSRIEIESEGGLITLKSKMEKILRKEFWRLKLLKVNKNKNLVKMRNLEMDVSKGLVTRLETLFGVKDVVRVEFVGDFGEEFELLFLNVGEIGEKLEEEGDTIKDKLYQISLKHNPQFKNKNINGS